MCVCVCVHSHLGIVLVSWFWMCIFAMLSSQVCVCLCVCSHLGVVLVFDVYFGHALEPGVCVCVCVCVCENCDQIEQKLFYLFCLFYDFFHFRLVWLRAAACGYCTVQQNLCFIVTLLGGYLLFKVALGPILFTVVWNSHLSPWIIVADELSTKKSYCKFPN